MPSTVSNIVKFFSSVSEHPEVAEAWAAAGADVRFLLTDPEVDITLRRDGRVTDDPPTHVLRISWPDLEDVIEGRRSFLRTVTGGRLSMTGPVMQSLAVGQALTAFAALPR